MSFVHLEVKSEYTNHFDSLVRLSNLIEHAKKMKMSAVALTDETSMHAVIDFYKLAKKEGIKPIIGCQFDILVDGKNHEKVTLLAKNIKGYLHLVKLSSLSHLRGKSDVYLTREEIKKRSNDLVVLLDFEAFFKHKNEELVARIPTILSEYQTFIPNEDLYVTLKYHGLTYQTTAIKHMVKVSQEKQVELVATNDVKYMGANGAKAREVLIAIKDNDDIKEPESNQAYFKSEDEMKKIFSSLPKAISNTLIIAEKCNLTIPLKSEGYTGTHLPQFQVPKDFQPPKTLNGKFKLLKTYKKPSSKQEILGIAYFCHLAEQGLERLYGNDDSFSDILEDIKDRLRYELGVIISKGFANYFLIVQDFVKYAKVEGIPIGLGRGSAVGSLVSYCLGITDVCPITYKLLFERFMNAERMDDTDIDLDISAELRYLIVNYAIEKYGRDKVAKIVTFNRFQGKKAIQDVGRVLNIKASISTQLSKNIKKSVQELMEKGWLVSRLMKEEPLVKELLEYAAMIEGMPSNRSIHAAGIILSNDRLFNYIPVMITEDDETKKPILFTQFTKDGQLEESGFTKFDFLALRNLDVKAKAVELIEKTTNKKVSTIPLNDAKTFELFQKGHTLGVFQMDSDDMRSTSRRVKPVKVEDIFPLIALFRPGSMDMIPEYVKNKEKNNVDIYDANGELLTGIDDIAPILKETYGVIVFQEQIMKIVQIWAGYGLGQAEIFRQAISKKKKDALDKQEEEFLSRSKKMNRDEHTSKRIYDLIVKFANYGFNFPHSAAYGIFSYQTAYLKAHYPYQYMSVLISSVMDKVKKAVPYIQDARRMGIKMQKPNINTSYATFVPTKEGIAFGLTLIKHVGYQVAESIVEERKQGLFSSFDDFKERCPLKKDVMEALIKAGAFDEFGSRKLFLEKVGDKTSKNALAKNQFTFLNIPNIKPDIQVEEFSTMELIKMEREAIGIPFTPTPLQEYGAIIQHAVQRQKVNAPYSWKGFEVVSVNKTKTKKGDEMAFAKVTDGLTESRLTIFPQTWSKVKELFIPLHVVLCKLKPNEEENEFILDAAETIEGTSMMEVKIPSHVATYSKENQVKWLNQLGALIAKYPGDTVLTIQLNGVRRTYGVYFSKEFLSLMIKHLKGKENIKMKKVQYK